MISIFLSAVSGVLIILIMVVVGFVLNERGWFNEQSPRIISRLVTQISLPCYMVTTIMHDFSAGQL